MRKKEKFSIALPIGLSPADIFKVKGELESALKAKCTIEKDDYKVNIYISRGTIPKKIKYIKPCLNGESLSIPIGFSHEGLELLDMASDSHCYMLVGGNPGTGKSNFLNQIIHTLDSCYSPEQVQMILIDLKMGVEFAPFEDLESVWLTAYDPDNDDLEYILEAIRNEIKRRMREFRSVKVRKISEYHALGYEMPYMILIIDEYAELKNKKNKEQEEQVKSLLQIGRAAGLRAILATQRPTTDNISGSVKALCTDRICFKVAGEINSRVILDEAGAELLPDIPGRAIFLTGATFKELQVMHYE